MLFVITRRKDILYYSIFLMLSAAYFFLNAPNTFFGLNDETVFNSAIYRQGNIPLIIITNLFYVLFLKVFFSGLVNNKLFDRLFQTIFLLSPVLIVAFFISRFLKIDTQSIFYMANLLVATISIFIISSVFRHGLPNTGWVAWGMLFNILGTALTLLMIVLERYHIRNMFTVDYPLLFMRLGILADLFFYQVALLKKWHYQEKQLAVEKLESLLEVEKLRNRISGELHDDIGSTVSGIAMYSHLVEGQLQSGNYDKAKDAVGIIQKSANEIVDKLGDLVWAINPGQDSLDAVLEKLHQYGEEMCKAKNILFKNDSDVGSLAREPGMDVRQQLYLVAKEAINNAVKYSDAKMIHFKAALVNDRLDILIADDGKGFDETVIKGNGLDNMQKRAALIGGIFKIKSAKEHGTSVELSVKITH